MYFLRKSMKKFRVLDCLASSYNLFQIVNRNSCINLFLLVLFDSYVHWKQS